MERYLRHQFYQHPGISAVLARHLADNYVKPDDSQGAKLKALETQMKSLDAAHKTRLTALETSHTTLQSHYDTLRVALQQKEPKDTKEKGDTKSTKNRKGNPVAGSG